MIENFTQFMKDPKKEEQLETFGPLDDLEDEFCVPIWMMALAVSILGLLLWCLLDLVASNACGL